MIATTSDLLPMTINRSGEGEQQPLPLDDIKLQRLVALDGTDFMRQMVKLFSVQAEAAGDNLRAAHHLNDLLQFREIAHALLSSAVNVGADRVALEASRLQRVPVNVFALGVASLLTPILAEINTVQAEIAQRIQT